MAENPFLVTPPAASSSSNNAQPQTMGYHQHNINTPQPQMMMGYQQPITTSTPQSGHNPQYMQTGQDFGIQSPSPGTHSSLTTTQQPASQWAITPASTTFDPFSPAPAPAPVVPSPAYAPYEQQSPLPPSQNFAQTTYSPSSNGIGSSPSPPGQNIIGYGPGSFQSPPQNHAGPPVESNPFGGFEPPQPTAGQVGQSLHDNPFASYDNSMVQVPNTQAFPSPAPQQVENHKAPPSQSSFKVENQVTLPGQKDESQGRELVAVQSRPDNNSNVRNPYSAEIARRERPPGASPLPKADLVRKRG